MTVKSITLKEFAKALNKQKLSNEETRALLEKIYDDGREASLFFHKWRVEEKSPDPAHIEIIPNSNSLFSKLEITQSIGEESYFPTPKIVKEGQKKN